MSTATDTAVTTSVVVDVPQARAFAVFTDEIGTWWNPDHHLLPERTTLTKMVFEPRAGSPTARGSLPRRSKIARLVGSPRAASPSVR